MRDVMKWTAIAVVVVVGLMWVANPWGAEREAEAAPVLAVPENRVAVIYKDLTAFKADWEDMVHLPTNQEVLQIRVMMQFSDPAISGPDEVRFSSHEAYYGYATTRTISMGQRDPVVSQTEDPFDVPAAGWPGRQNARINVDPAQRSMRAEGAIQNWLSYDPNAPDFDDLLDLADAIPSSTIEVVP